MQAAARRLLPCRPLRAWVPLVYKAPSGSILAFFALLLQEMCLSAQPTYHNDYGPTIPHFECGTRLVRGAPKPVLILQAPIVDVFRFASRTVVVKAPGMNRK